MVLLLLLLLVTLIDDPPSFYTPPPNRYPTPHASASSPWASSVGCCSCTALSSPNPPLPSSTTGSGDADSAVRCASAALALVRATRETMDEDGAVGGKGAGDGCRWDLLASAVASEGAGEAAAAEAPPAAGLALLARLPVCGVVVG